jgi:hypothetical protein
MSDNYILTATFHLGKINKNGDILNIANFPVNSGTITLEHKVSKEDFEKYMNSKYKDVISMECKECKFDG